MSIPKVIHYCWFGPKQIPDKYLKYMESWKEYLPGYEIRCWDESNTDLNSCDYIKEAYENKKYAFVSDYVRICALYEHGGIYMDTDVELVQSPEECLKQASFVAGFELEDTITTGFLASEPKHFLLEQIMTEYQEKHFVKTDGTFDTTPNPVLLTRVLTENGLIKNNSRQKLQGGVEVYPNDTFCAFNMVDTCYMITNCTIAVHHYAGSWYSKRHRFISWLKLTVSRVLGVKRYRRLKRILKKPFR